MGVEVEMDDAVPVKLVQDLMCIVDLRGKKKEREGDIVEPPKVG